MEFEKLLGLLETSYWRLLARTLSFMLVTSANSSLNWDLRCKVREALIDFMQRDYPQFLPLLRAELTPAPASEMPPAATPA